MLNQHPEQAAGDRIDQTLPIEAKPHSSLSKEKLLTEIQFLYEDCNKNYNGDDDHVLDKVFFRTSVILNYLYGENSRELFHVVRHYDKMVKSDRSVFSCRFLNSTLMGVLSALQFELENNLIKSLSFQIQGELFADFISLAEKLLQQGHKDSAAILACAAFEDSLKRLAHSKGLNVEDKDLSTVIDALKSIGYFKGATGSVAKSFVQLRNKAFHAEFSKVDTPEVSSLLAFLKEFLSSNFKQTVDND